MTREQIEKVFKTLKQKIAEREEELYRKGLKVKNGVLEKRIDDLIIRRKVGKFTTLMV